MSKLKKNLIPLSVCLVLSVLACAIFAGQGKILSENKLLKAVRLSQGITDQPSYENRMKQQETVIAVNEESKPMMAEEPVEEAQEEPVALIEEETKPQVQKAEETQEIMQQATSTTVLTKDEILAMLPAESLFVVRINNLDNSLTQVDQFLAGTVPIPMGVTMLVRSQFAKLLGSPDLKGLDTNGTLAGFGLSRPTGDSKNDIIQAVLLPVSDFGLFTSGNPNVSEPDAEGIAEITVAGETVLVKSMGDFALAVPGSKDDIKLVSQSLGKAERLSGKLDASEMENAINKQLWIYGNINQVSEKYGDLLFGKIEEAKQTMQQLDLPKSQTNGQYLEKTIEIYSKFLKKIMEGTKVLSISLEAKPEVLTMSNSLYVNPGTEFGDIFADITPTEGKNKYLSFLQDGVVANASGKYTQLDTKMSMFFFSLLCENISSDNMKKVEAMADSAKVALGDYCASTFSFKADKKPPMSGMYVAEVKDEEKLKKLWDEGIEFFNSGSLKDFWSDFGLALSFNRGPTTQYKGLDIESAKFVMGVTEANNPGKEMMDNLYGSGIECKWVVKDGLCLCAYGYDAEKGIQSLIDNSSDLAAMQIPQEIREAFNVLPAAEQMDYMGTFNFVRYLKALSSMELMPKEMPFSFGKIDIPTKSNMIFAGDIEKEKASFIMALPKEHLVELMQVGMALQQQMMQQTQQNSSTSQEDQNSL